MGEHWTVDADLGEWTLSRKLGIQVEKQNDMFTRRQGQRSGHQ